MVEPSTPCTLHDLMTSHRKRNLADDCSFSRISVDRETFWEDCLISFKNPKFDIKSGLRVKFILLVNLALTLGGYEQSFVDFLLKQCSHPRLPYSRVTVIDASTIQLISNPIQFIWTCWKDDELHHSSLWCFHPLPQPLCICTPCDRWPWESCQFVHYRRYSRPWN